jgi:nucleoid-associated protein YgaU
MLDCPVCPRKNVNTDTCPQCGANLKPLLRLAEVIGSYSREGTEHLAAGRVDEAILSFSAASALEGAPADVCLSLGKAYASKGMSSEALSQFNRALELEPGNEEVRGSREALVADQKRLEAGERSRREQQQTRDRRNRRLLVVTPAVAFLLGLALLHVVQVFRRPPVVGLPALAQRVRETLAGEPSLASVKPDVVVSGHALQVSAEVPSEVHAELLKSLAQSVADGRVLLAGVRIQPPPPVPQMRYRIRPGDSFWSIAQTKYGNAGLWPKIEALNRGPLRKAGLLYPGDEIVLPALTVMPK